MDNIEEENKGLYGNVDVSLGRPCSSETTTQSFVKPCANTVQEVVEPLRFCQGLTEKNDVIAGINDGLVEENSGMTDRESKRRKMSDLVDGSSTDMQESGSLDESLLCCRETEKTASTSDGRLVSQNSNGGRNEAHDVQLRQGNPKENQDIAENSQVLDVASNARFAHNLNSEGENDSKFGSISSVDEPERNTDPCLPPLDESTNIASQDVSKRKLLVLDINGLLVSISSYVPYDSDPDDIILRKAVFKRPYCDDFLKFCFEKFNVGIWTSKTRRNMEPIIDFLFGIDKHKLLFCWDQSHCTETGFATVEKKNKPILLKKLKKLWDKYDPNLPWKKGEYDQTNTVLVDDSPHKALCNPQYTAVFPYTYHFRSMNDHSLGPAGDLRLYLEDLANAENVQEYIKQNPFGQRPITERNLSWRYYLRVIEASTTPPRRTD